MSVWSRLSRLARSEMSSAARRVRQAVQDFGSGDDGDDRGSDGREAEPDGDGAEPRRRSSSARDPYPKEVREAYAALELTPGADKAEVRRAYRDMMRRYHPDKHQADPDKERLANEITVRLKDAKDRLDRWHRDRA